MDSRELKVSFGKSGNGGVVNRITIPTKWVKKMGIEKGDYILAHFDGENYNRKNIKKGGTATLLNCFT